jgi:DNA-binding CsgD family transcriptional regulator
MIFKNKEHIYLLKDKSFDPSFIQTLAREKGLQVIMLENEDDLKNILKQTPLKPTASDEKEDPLVFLHHIEKKTARDRFSRFFGYIQWLIAIMNDLHVGFMMSDGNQPLLISPLARDISGADAFSADRHPIEKILQEEEKRNFKSSIQQLQKGEIHQLSIELPIEPPYSPQKKVLFYGKTLNLNRWSIVVEYLIEKRGNPSASNHQNTYNRALVMELHKILTSLCGLTGLNLAQENDHKKQKKGKIKERSGYNLTKREKEILKFIYEGHTSKQIAEKLYISKRTVESHRANILHKTNSHNTAELIRFAIGNNLL